MLPPSSRITKNSQTPQTPALLKHSVKTLGVSCGQTLKGFHKAKTTNPYWTRTLYQALIFAGLLTELSP